MVSPLRTETDTKVLGRDIQGRAKQFSIKSRGSKRGALVREGEHGHDATQRGAKRTFQEISQEEHRSLGSGIENLQE